MCYAWGAPGVVCAATNANASLSRHAGNGTMHVVLHVGGAFDVHRMYRSETRVSFPSGVGHSPSTLSYAEPGRSVTVSHGGSGRERALLLRVADLEPEALATAAHRANEVGAMRDGERDALEARARQLAQYDLENGSVADRKERLRDARDVGLQALALAAGEDDRVHQKGANGGR